MSVARYMELCLGHPHHGYYMTRDPFGHTGDFITAPEISQMFGELVGIWCADTWFKMGSPSPCALVELGPGRGTLMVDALRALRKIPAMSDALSITLVETSPILRQSQQKALSEAGFTIKWAESVFDLPKAPILLIANEFLDALPIHQFIQTDLGWRERVIGLNENGQLRFGLSPEPIVGFGKNAPVGSIVEEARISASIIEHVANRVTIDNGAALFIDYGPSEANFGDTFQAVKAHAFVDPLRFPGEADLTAHVNFAAIGEMAKRCGASISGPVTQREFLLALGLSERASRLSEGASDVQRRAIQEQFDRLTQFSETGMGALFKVAALHHPQLRELAGFWQAE
ncbi:MAG: class I SAM-dependent methyltransferase [Hyphomicrobiales bacterium]